MIFPIIEISVLFLELNSINFPSSFTIPGTDIPIPIILLKIDLDNLLKKNSNSSISESVMEGPPFWSVLECFFITIPLAFVSIILIFSSEICTPTEWQKKSLKEYSLAFLPTPLPTLSCSIMMFFSRKKVIILFTVGKLISIFSATSLITKLWLELKTYSKILFSLFSLMFFWYITTPPLCSPDKITISYYIIFVCKIKTIVLNLSFYFKKGFFYGKLRLYI